MHRKGQKGRRPQTLVRLTKRGRNAFLAYLEELERVIRDARSADAEQSTDGPPGWVPA